MIELSVVIPTHNKKEILKMTLEALDRQTYPFTGFEVIIVDDGSSDGTATEVKKLTPKLKFKTSIFSQKNQGPASARNKGIKKAKGKIILIINDDTVANPDLIARHFSFHQKNPSENLGLLGYVTWHPNLKVTPFMVWLEHGGPYFSFSKIQGKEVGWERFWTCNISFKKNFLLKHGLFDEEFPYASWEDVELGYRLGKAGLKLLYDSEAVGYHYHPTAITSIKSKMRNNGLSVLILKKKLPSNYLPPLGRHPQLFAFLDAILYNSLFSFLLEKTCLFFENKLNTGFIYDILLLHYRISGLKEGLRVWRQ